MRNSEITKEKIITTSGNLFNSQGYKATSISDITKATGLTKGAIYRHFKNKEDLEQQALNNLAKLMFGAMTEAVKSKKTFPEKFDAIFSFFEKYLSDPIYEGGCPLLNAAVEGDDANPILRHKALKMFHNLKKTLINLVHKGIKYEQVKPEVQAEVFATIVIATLEGGIMISKLEKNPVAIKAIINHLRSYVETIRL